MVIIIEDLNERHVDKAMPQMRQGLSGHNQAWTNMSYMPAYYILATSGKK